MKRYIRSNSYFSKDVASISDIEDEIFKAMQAGTTKDDIEDYLIELESDGIIDREEFKDLKQSTFSEFDRYQKTFGSSTIRADWAEDLSEDLKDVDTSDWSKMMSDKYEDDIRNAGGYDKYIEKERITSSLVSPNPQATPEQKEYVYRCVADSPEVPDMDAPEEEWSVFRRDEKEYKAWAFADAVEDGIFVDDEYNLFNNLWAAAETDMAAPYA